MYCQLSTVVCRLLAPHPTPPLIYFCRSIGIYLDTINIFIRILYIMMNSNSRRK